MADRDRGPWVLLYSGTKFYPAAPRVEDVKAIDIAHHCSMLTRYTGAVHVLPGEDYTVAEHQILVAQALRSARYPVRTQLLGLIHDASEMITSDQSRPFKESYGYYEPRHSARRAANVVEWAIRVAVLSVAPAVSRTAFRAVKSYDRRIVVDEMRALFPPEHLIDVPAMRRTKPLGVTLHKWPAYRAEMEYLRLLKQLCDEVGRSEFYLRR